MNHWTQLALVAGLFAGLVACETQTEAPTGGTSAPTQQQASGPSGASSTGSRAATLPGGQKLTGTPTQIADITWGGDFATLYGNGGAQTREDTIFAQHGLNMKVVLGDDFDAQLEDYKARRTPFLRGTFTMVGVHAGELCGIDPGLCPEYAFQMTYSLGDHLVVREGIETLKDLRGKTVAIQKGGPHLGFLYEALADEGLTWDDMNIRWVKDLDGPDGPAALFAQDTSIDAAFVITPDLYTLTGGPNSVGTGAENSVKGASMVVSTAQRRRTIADTYFVSAEWADAHPDELRNFAMAYLQSAEAVKELQNAYDQGGSPVYTALVESAFQRYPVFNGLSWEDADGLYRDASFVGHTGNVKFMNPDPGVPGFADFVERSVQVAGELGLPDNFTINSAGIDWTHPIFSGLTTYGMQRQSAFDVEAVRGEVEAMAAAGTLGDNASIRFTAHFERNQATFNASDYTAQFDRLLDLAGKYSTAPIVLSCHVDTAGVIDAAFTAARDANVLQQTGSPGNWTYTIDGRELDTTNVDEVTRVIMDPRFNQQIPKNRQPANLAEQALTLSLKRCESGKEALLGYARSKGITLDPNQIVPTGMGVRQPVFILPRGEDQHRANRRIEFSLTQVSLETSDFDW